MSAALDVAVVGPGTVGIYLAAALADRPGVALIGGRTDRDALVGASPSTSGHLGVLHGWRGGYGGTSTAWGGQLWPWQHWEIAGGPFRQAWPLDYHRDLAPHYEQVLTRLGLDADHRSAVHERAGAERWPGLRTRGTEVRYSTWMDRRHRDFRRNPALRPRASRVPRIPVDVARLRPLPNGRHALLDGDGNELAVARTVVLAAGTLGNVRLLQDHATLTSSSRPVGRFFGDHLSARAARACIVERDRFEDFAASELIRHGRMTTRLATTEGHCAESNAMPGYAHFELSSPTVAAARALLGARGTGALPAGVRLLRESGRLPRQAGAVLRSVPRHRRPLDPTAEVFLRVDVEQPLRETSVMRWDDSGDLRLDWGVGVEESDAVSSALQRFTPVVEEHLGVQLEAIPEVRLDDIYHLVGGTRMGRSDDPSAVVDEHLRVIDADGLLVAGASTFPSGGMANPTFTALSLADRLVQHLT